MKLMTTSSQGRDLIKSFEGLRLDAYRCPAGVPTIGWGHTKGVRMGQHITQAQAEDMLTEDIAPAEHLLNGMKINFRQCQFDALVSWIFNLGSGNFKSSTMYKRIIENATDEEIADQMVRWVNADGRPLPGLMKRRAAEANLFLDYEKYRIVNGKITKS